MLQGITNKNGEYRIPQELFGLTVEPGPYVTILDISYAHG